MSELRERRHDQTRHAILDAAVELFSRQGFHDTTMEQIAAGAGVSRRTLYRRFRGKDDVVLELPRRWLHVWDRSVAEQSSIDGKLDAVTVIERAALAVSAHIDANRQSTLVGLRVLEEAPSLNATSLADDDWHDRVVALLASSDPTAQLDPDDQSLLAGAYLGGINAMLALWAAADETRSLVELNEKLNARFRAVWDDAGVRSDVTRHVRPEQQEMT